MAAAFIEMKKTQGEVWKRRNKIMFGHVKLKMPIIDPTVSHFEYGAQGRVSTRKMDLRVVDI